MIHVKDNFLEEFEEFNELARTLEYDGEFNPIDGVDYPDINLTVPQFIEDEIVAWCSDKVERQLQATTCFLRLSMQGTPCPNECHNDLSMGKYAFVMYMQDGPGGTAFVKHKQTQVFTQPWTATELNACVNDSNTPEAWEVTKMVDMKANRAILYPARVMHRAEPVGGFGDTIEDGRLVLTAFMDLA